MDEVRLKSGRVRRGLVREVTKDEVDFVEVVRPAGRPLYLVIMSLDPKSVERIDRITAQERELLLEKIGPLLKEKSSLKIEAGRMEDVELREIVRDGVRYHLCHTNWFTLESTADEASTRRCIVRIEQVFRAFRRLLPPRSEPRGDLRVQLFGSMDEYRRHLDSHGLRIENPAYYSSTRNTIAAGSDLVRYAERLAKIREENEKVRRHYEQKNREINQRLFELGKELLANGFDEKAVEAEKKIRKAAWDREYKAMVGDGGKLAQIERENVKRFDLVVGQMFRRLYHEAFHAYLENHAYPSDKYRVPRWLNEGLAQIFENGQLDPDNTLRIDAPDRATLVALQVELAREPLPLASLMEAEEQSFLFTHGDPHASRRHYLYSWGLAWHLAFHEDVLGTDRLQQYLAADIPVDSPTERFEQLVGKPLTIFEGEWREAIFSSTSAR